MSLLCLIWGNLPHLLSENIRNKIDRQCGIVEDIVIVSDNKVVEESESYVNAIWLTFPIT